MKTHVTIEYMVKSKRKWLSRSVLAGIIDGGVNENERGVNHNDLQRVDSGLYHH